MYLPFICENRFLGKKINFEIFTFFVCRTFKSEMAIFGRKSRSQTLCVSSGSALCQLMLKPSECRAVFAAIGRIAFGEIRSSDLLMNQSLAL